MIGALCACVGFVFDYYCLRMCFNSCKWLMKFVLILLFTIVGEVSVMGNVDPDLLSHFEIQDICAEVGGLINNRIYYLISGVNLEEGLRLSTLDDDVTYMCELHAEWLTNEITLYVEPEVQLVAV